MAESKRRASIREAAGELKERFAQNPFLDEMALVIRTKTFARKVVGITVSEEGSGLPKPVFYHGSRNIDTEPFTKIFPAAWTTLAHLSRAGLLLLGYVCEQVLPGNSIVWLDRDKFLAKGYGLHNFYNGMDELIGFNLLARTEKRGFYFINPACFFNGNRIEMRHEYTKPK